MYYMYSQLCIHSSMLICVITINVLAAFIIRIGLPTTLCKLHAFPPITHPLHAPICEVPFELL